MGTRASYEEMLEVAESCRRGAENLPVNFEEFIGIAKNLAEETDSKAIGKRVEEMKALKTQGIESIAATLLQMAKSLEEEVEAHKQADRE